MHKHSDNDAVVQANVKHWSKTAEDEVDPRWIKLARDGGEMLRTMYNFDKQNTTVLDFACGIGMSPTLKHLLSGLVCRELHPYAKYILGIDNAAPAIDRFNREVRAMGIPQEELRGLAYELTGDTNDLNGQKFDVVVCTSAYHHFANIQDITKLLVSYLKPGGSLLVLDYVLPDTKVELQEPYKSIIVKMGFTAEKMMELFKGVGLTEFKFKTGPRVLLGEGMNPETFVAMGTLAI